MENGASILAQQKVIVDVKASIDVQLINGEWVKSVAEVDAKFSQDATYPQIAGQIIREFWPSIAKLGGVVKENDNQDEPLDFIPIGSILRIRPTFPRIATASRVPKTPPVASGIIV